MASKLTKYDLDNVTDYLEFESFCHDLMSREGYKDIEPLGGNKDKGRDAIHVDKSTGTVTIFTYSVREDWEEKLYEDLEKIAVVHKHHCDRVIFLTTGRPTATENDNVKQDVKKEYGFNLEVYDLERIATLVDNQYQDLRFPHSNIFFVSSHVINTFSPGNDLDRKAYAEYLLRLHEEWLHRYTPLLAKHREVDTYAVLTGSSRADTPDIPVGMIPEAGVVSVLLGESGSGKTTALWRICVEASKAIVDGRSEKLPVLLSLKGWSNTQICRNLVQDQSDLLDTGREALGLSLGSNRMIAIVGDLEIFIK
ncbi:MAG TPA: restriction endonuclease [Pyrinomonadaceae bacterium]|nr:restriction endonuclease [Pyrinomonadaceae bacterium]